MSPKKGKLSNLFADALDEGVISPQTSTLLSGDLGSLVIAGAAGKELEEIEASEVTLVTILLDASSSMMTRGLEQAACEGYNSLLQTFANSEESENILVALWLFHDGQQVIHSYVSLDEAARLNKQNYQPGGTTHLYDTWCKALGANVAYAQQLRDSGTPCRSIVVVITDGEDVGSQRRLSHCRQLSKDLLDSERFVLAFVGLGAETHFRWVAQQMGIPEHCVAVQEEASPASLRRVFHQVSLSTIRVSQAMIQPGAQAGFFR